MGLAQIRRKQEEARQAKKGGVLPPSEVTIPDFQNTTAVKLKAVPPMPVKTPTIVLEPLLTPIPNGYSSLGKHDVQKLFWLKEEIIKAGIFSFDYETKGDTSEDSDTSQDPQDSQIVGVSVAYKIGMAVYLPVAHDSYGANWDVTWLVENFLKPILSHPNVMVIAHNIKFEGQVSRLYGIDLLPKAVAGKVMDTMLMVKSLGLKDTLSFDGRVIVGLKPSTKALLTDNAGMIHGLLHVDDVKSFKETCGTKEVPIPGEFYTSGKKKGQQKTASVSRSFNELPVDKVVIEYGCSDADWALGLYHKLLPITTSEGVLDVLIELDVPFMLTLGEYEMAGWHMNRKGLTELGNQVDEAMERIMPELTKALGEVTEGYADFDEKGDLVVPAGFYGMGSYKGNDCALEIKTEKPFNWGSIQHLQWLFFHVLKVSTAGLERSKTSGLPGTGRDNLDKIIERFTGDSAFVKLLKEKKKYDKIRSTYIDGLLPFCRQDTDKVHTSFNLVSTWRLSSKKPNFQNFPRADNDPVGIRNMFIAPSYDMQADYSYLRYMPRSLQYALKNGLSGEMVFIDADYAQIELKILAWYALEQMMMSILASGGDLHSAVAKEVFHLDCEIEEVKKKYKPYRYRAKKVSFGLVYGMTEHGLSADPQMGMTTDEAKQFIEKYMERFPGVRKYMKQQIEFCRENGYVQSMFNHRRPIPDINHASKWIRQSAENQSINAPIQSSASDVIRLAMVNIRKELDEKAPWLEGVTQIHDQLVFECPVEYASEGVRFVKELMERPIEGFSDIMPITADVGVGKIWGHVLDIEYENGIPFVKPKKERKEGTDVTYEDIEPYRYLYDMAGIQIK